MIMCRQVAKALANNRYYELPARKRIAMFIHIRLCIMCGKYHQQVVDMQKGVKTYLDQEEVGNIEPQIHLPDDAKERIRNALKNG